MSPTKSDVGARVRRALTRMATRQALGSEISEQTRPEDCFASPADAEAAGYRRSQR